MTKSVLQYEEETFKITVVIHNDGKAYNGIRYRQGDEGKIKFIVNR